MTFIEIINVENFIGNSWHFHVNLISYYCDLICDEINEDHKYKQFW